VTTPEIYGVLEMKSREVGAFSEFFSRRREVEHAYEMLRGIEGKPGFDEVCAYLDRFLSPFVQKDEIPRVWNTGTSKWDDIL
jgi:hypothetical protein